MKLSTKVAYNAIVQIISKIIAIILGLVAIGFIFRYLGTNGFGEYTTIITFLSFFFIALNQIFVGLFQKNLRLDKVSIAEIASRIVLVIGVIYVVKLDYGLRGILFATVISSFVSFILHFYFSRRFALIGLRFDFAYWKKIIIRSWPLAVTIVLNLIYLKTDILFLSLIQRPTSIGMIAEVGLYGAAYKVIDVVIIFPFMFAGIILPILTSLWARGDKDSFNTILQKSIDVLMIIAIPLVIGTQFVSRGVMLLIAGNDFVESGPILRFLIVAAGMIFVGNMFAHAIIAIDRQKSAIKIYLFTAVSSLIGYLIFIPHFSYFGAAGVTIYSETVITLGSIYLVYKFTKFFPNFIIIFKSFFASLFMVFGIYILKFLDYFYLPLVLVVSVAIYFLFLFLFKGISKNDINILLNK